MHIVIIGSGIAGLSTYLFLRKHLPQSQKHTIVIYEAHDLQPYIDSIAATSLGTGAGADPDGSRDCGKPDEPSSFTPEAIGSAIGISLNGLNVLSRLGQPDINCPDQPRPPTEPASEPESKSQLIANLLRNSHPVHTWQMSSARGWKLIDVSMLPKQAKSMDGNKDRKKNKNAEGGTAEGVDGVMISRQAFWRLLLAEVVRVSGSTNTVHDLVKKRRVTEIVWPRGKECGRGVPRGGGGGGRLEAVFEDGLSEKADLIIGADGLRSVVRKAMFQSQVQVAARDSARASGEGDDTDVAKQPAADAASASASPSPTGLLSLAWLRQLWRSSSARGTDHGRNGHNYVSPNYEGLVGVGGFIPSSVLKSADPPHQPGNMGIVFGPNGFFGYGYITTSPGALPTYPTLSNVAAQIEPGPKAVWWSTFASKEENPFPVQIKAGEATASSRPRRPWDFDHAAALSSLLARHKSWQNPTVHAIVHHLEHSSPPAHTVSDLGAATAVEGLYPTWTSPWLPTWHKQGVVLIGDAAHALQPSSGQGACQALEDAETLALCLGHYLKSGGGGGGGGGGAYQRVDEPQTVESAESVAKALRVFEKVRMPRVKEIYDRSQRMGRMKEDMGFVSEMFMYAFFKIMGLLGGILGDGGMHRMLSYDLPLEVKRVLDQEEAAAAAAAAASGQ